MGWQLDLFLLVVAFVCIPFGAWILTVPIIVYLVAKPIMKMREKKGKEEGGRGGRGADREAEGPAGDHVSSRSFRRLWFLPHVGFVILLLSGVAYLKGGVFSPVVLALVGLGLISYGNVSDSSFLAKTKAVKESAAYRTSVLPFKWSALAQIKPITRDLGRALSAVNDGTLLVVSTERASLYVELAATALTSKSAEEKLGRRFRELTATLVPLGAYLLPLDGEQAGEVLRFSMQALKVDEKNVVASLNSAVFDAISLEPKEGYVRAVGVYRRIAGEAKGRAILTTKQNLAKGPRLGDVVKSLDAKVNWPSPDSYTAFLSSVFATRDEPAERIVDLGTSESGLERVKSHGTPAVELSKAQLKAVERMYERPGKE